MTTVTKPSKVAELSKKSLELARMYQKTDPCSSMLHCRRSLEVVIFHLLDEKQLVNNSYPQHLAQKIKSLKLERPGKYFAVNRLTSSWIHWTPKGTQEKSEIGTCIYLMGKILEEIFGITPEESSKEYTMFDALTKNLSEASGAIYLLGGV